MTSKKVLNAAINGDVLAIEVIDSATEYIGISIDTLVKLFNPEAITLSGGLSDNEEYYVERIRTKVHAESLPIYKEKIPILTSSFGEEAALMGAFSLMLHSILRLE